MMRRAALTISLIALILLATRQGSSVRSQDTGATPVAYLPIVEVDGPTLTPSSTPTNTPTITSTPSNTATATHTRTPLPTSTIGNYPNPESPCNQNAPFHQDGLQSWMTITSPSQFSYTTLCTRMTLGGVVPGLGIHAVAHYKTTDTDLGIAYAGTDGVAKFTFNIGGATSGYTVLVESNAIYLGENYHSQTTFTPP
jgi:hypothetical protein